MIWIVITTYLGEDFIRGVYNDRTRANIRHNRLMGSKDRRDRNVRIVEYAINKDVNKMDR